MGTLGVQTLSWDAATGMPAAGRGRAPAWADIEWASFRPLELSSNVHADAAAYLNSGTQGLLWVGSKQPSSPAAGHAAAVSNAAAAAPQAEPPSSASPAANGDTAASVPLQPPGLGLAQPADAAAATGSTTDGKEAALAGPTPSADPRRAAEAAVARAAAQHPVPIQEVRACTGVCRVPMLAASKLSTHVVLHTQCKVTLQTCKWWCAGVPIRAWRGTSLG